MRRHVNRVLAGIVAVMAVALAVAGCGGSGSAASSSEQAGSASGGEHPQSGGRLVLSQGTETQGFNPLIQFTPESVNLMSQVEDTLFAENLKGTVVPALVESYKQNKEATEWVLNLRKGVKFSNGHPMTSADVKWTLETDKKNEIYGSIVERFGAIEAPTANKIIFHTKLPTPELPILLSQWSFAIMPENFGGESESEFNVHPIGTGPFELASWHKGSSLTFRRNPYYWRPGRPYLKELVFETVPDEESRTAQVRSGRLDAMFGPPFQEIESLESEPDLTVDASFKGYSWYIGPNMRQKRFQNANLREAMSLAISREALNKVAVAGLGQEAASYTAPVVIGYDGSLKVVKQDVSRAKQLVAQAKKEGVTNLNVSITMVESPFWTPAIQVVQQELDNVGFNVTVKKRNNGAALEEFAEGKFDIQAELNINQTQTLGELFGYYNGNEGNYAGVDTTQTSQLTKKALETVQPSKRNAIWHQLQEIVYKQNSLIMLMYTPYVWVYNNKVHGLFIGKAGVPWLWNTWITE